MGFLDNSFRVMKLGTRMQALNTSTLAKFQGQPPVISPFSLTCVVFKVIEPKCKQGFLPI